MPLFKALQFANGLGEKVDGEGKACRSLRRAEDSFSS